ncbi:MAG: PRTRC system ThiF family protein [Bryobacteraceae bacterium]
MTHNIPAHLLRCPIRSAVIGCGGNGSVIAMGLPYLHQALLAAGHPGGLAVTLIDGDTVSSTNCVRQPFSRNEVGLHKSIVLASRINLFWGLRWKAIPHHVAPGQGVESADIVIGCVDTRAARATIQELVTGNATVTYYLDLGNGATGGQFILGQPLNRRNPRRATRLRTAPELFPELADTTLPDDDQPSCSAQAALDRQEPMVNQLLATHALALLARLFRHGAIEHQGAFVDSVTNRAQPFLGDTSTWRRLRRPHRPGHHMSPTVPHSN